MLTLTILSSSTRYQNQILPELAYLDLVRETKDARLHNLHLSFFIRRASEPDIAWTGLPASCNQCFGSGSGLDLDSIRSVCYLFVIYTSCRCLESTQCCTTVRRLERLTCATPSLRSSPPCAGILPESGSSLIRGFFVLVGYRIVYREFGIRRFDMFYTTKIQFFISVADPGCLSRILILPIPDPGSKNINKREG